MSATRHPFFSCLRALALLALAVSGAVLRAAPPPGQPNADPDKAVVYRIATNDQLRIGVFQEPDLDIVSRVDINGTVNLNLIGPIKIAGMTIPEAESAIEKAYIDQWYLRHPQVTISVEQYAPREVSIQGQIRAPGRYVLPIEQSMTVLELVTKAGGFTDTAKGTAVRVTRINPDGTQQVFTVDVESTIRGKSSGKKDTTLNLLPGDIVYVPERII